MTTTTAPQKREIKQKDVGVLDYNLNDPGSLDGHKERTRLHTLLARLEVGKIGTDEELQELESLAQERIAYIKGEIEAERISYGEIMELESLKQYVDPNDTLLAFWAGIPENGYKALLIKDGEVIDETGIDEESEELARELFQSFGHDLTGATIELQPDFD